MATVAYHGAETKADLYARIGSNWEFIRLAGNTSKGDQIGTVWQFDPNSNATDNFSGGVICPTANAGMNGRYLRQDNEPAQADWNASSGASQILNKPSIASDYYNTVAVAGGAGQSVYYLTSDKTSTGTALFTTIDAVMPTVNDPNVNYTSGWSYNAGTKALTVTTKAATGLYISLLGLTLLGAPAVVANGTNVQVVVKGH